MTNTITIKFLIALCTLSFLSFLSIAQQTDEMKMKTYLTSIEYYKYEGDTIQANPHRVIKYQWYDNQQLKEKVEITHYGGKRKKSIKQYNEQGLLTEEKSGNKELGCPWTTYEHTMVNYNDKAKILSKFEYKLNSGQTEAKLQKAEGYTYAKNKTDLLEIRYINYHENSDEIKSIHLNQFNYENNKIKEKILCSIKPKENDPNAYDTIPYKKLKYFYYTNQDSIVTYEISPDNSEITSLVSYTIITYNGKNKYEARFNIENNQFICSDEIHIEISDDELEEKESYIYRDDDNETKDTYILKYITPNKVEKFEHIKYIDNVEEQNNYFKQEFSYNQNLRLIEEKQVEKTNQGETYTSSLDQYTYDNNGDLTEKLSLVPNIDTELIPNYRSTYTTTEYLVDDLIRTEFPDGTYGILLSDHLLDSITFQKKKTDGWENTSLIKFNYEERLFDVSSIDTKSAIEYAIYPNPTDGVFTISSEDNNQSTIEIYNQTGSLCLSEKFKQETRLDISHLPSSIYYCRIISEDGKVTTKKVIIY